MTAPTRIGLLELSLESTDDSVTLRLSGQADMRDSSELKKHLLETHEAALGKKAHTVVVNVHEVEFMNSTALGAFVSWVGAMQAVEPARRYRLIFHGDSKRRWQRGSLHALASFAPEHISVELR